MTPTPPPGFPTFPPIPTPAPLPADPSPWPGLLMVIALILGALGVTILLLDALYLSPRLSRRKGGRP